MSQPLSPRFPSPSIAPHPLSAPRLPGISPDSTEALKEVLKDNHQRWHIFFNDMGFHNHASHRAIALWAIGAEGEVIHDGYKRDCGYEKPAIQSPQAITDQNWDEHLGNDKYYSGYVEFFVSYIEKHGQARTLEDWVFSPRANLGLESTKLPEDKHPRMLARFIAGALHPIIHAGYGAEFGLPGMLAEGLAQCAVHSADIKDLVPPALFDGTMFHTESGEAKKLSVWDILAKVRNELHVEAASKIPVDLAELDTTIAKNAKFILELASQWELDVDKLQDDKYLQARIEEVVFLVVSMYGVSGWTIRGEGQPIRADFFIMHLVTSSVFLPSLAALLTPVARGQLLHTYLVIAFSIYAFGGCPALDFDGFFAQELTPAKSNPWLSIIEHAVEHHDEHLTKTQRALLTWASHFGSRTAAEGGWTGSGIKGIEKLDGSLFLRAAQLTMARTGAPIKDHRPFSRPTEWDFPNFKQPPAA